MVKGTVRQESDIDGYLFVDADAVAEKYQQQNEKVEVIENEEKESGVETFFTREIESQYATEIRETLKLKANLNPEQVEHVRIRPISEQIIDQHTQSIIDGFHKEEEYENQFRQWEEENPEGKTTDLKKLTEYYKDRPKRPEPMIPSSTLISMFHLEVGGGIRKYRGSLISKLESMGEEGEKAWGEIIKGVEMLEQNLMSGTDKKYPRTLSEARSMYGTKKNDKTA